MFLIAVKAVLFLTKIDKSAVFTVHRRHYFSNTRHAVITYKLS